MSESAHLRVYRFEPGAVFQGDLLGALERMQLDPERELHDALFARRDAESEELEAVDLGAAGAGASFASLLDFRLDAGRRRSLTERTLTEHSRGVPPALIEAVAATLEAGAALLAVLQLGPEGSDLEEAVARCGGRRIADEPAEGRALGDVGAQLCSAVGVQTPAEGD